MDRRTFTTQMSKGLLITNILPQNMENEGENTPKRPKKIKPKRLKVGDTVGLIAPGSGIPKERIEKAIVSMERLGFKVKMGKYAYERNGFLAGTDAQRLEDLHNMFADKEVDAVWCLRGGYGCTRILPNVDYNLIKKNPKIIIGYSDITALAQAIFMKTGLVTFHGIIGVSDFEEYEWENCKALLMDATNPLVLAPNPAHLAKEEDHFKIEVIKSGVATGELIGGNLSLIAAMTGTAFDWDVKGKIIFLEDIEERPYRIDRMLTQLLQAHDLRQAAGIALGIFEGCDPKPDEVSQSLKEVLSERLGNLGIPVIYGLSFGHIKDQFSLPIGVKAKLDTNEKTLTILENAVI